MKRYLDWAGKEHSLRRRILALSLAGVFFVVIIPLLLIYLSSVLDRWMHLPRFNTSVYNAIAGIILIVTGGFLALWSIQAQMTIGSGTPLPMMPTVRLVVRAPFTYCRNPMTLGTCVLYSGVSVWIGSWSALAIVLSITIVLLLYIKILEEKELESRFGAEYLTYKQNTPFFLPRLKKLGKKE